MGGVSAHGSIPVPQEGGGVAESDSADMVHFRVGLNPLQGFNGLHDRRWDIGAGYLAQWFWPDGADRILYHGFHLEGAFFPWSATVDKSSFRLPFGAGLAGID